MLSRLNFGDDDSCAADSENESYKADYALPEKDAENKCMEPDDNSDVYTITRPPKKVSITTYAGDNQCVADENVMADDTMTGECVDFNGLDVTFEWTGVGIQVYRYAGTPECPPEDASDFGFFPSGDKDTCLEYENSGDTYYFKWGDSVGMSSDDDE